MPYGGTSFDIGRLSGDDKPKIPIAQVRPLVLRCVFQNEAPPFKDNLDLGKLLNITFREISTRGREASLIFIDADEFPLANQLSGRYNVTGNNISVTVYITQGDETKANFQIKENIGNMEQLVADILTKTHEHMKIHIEN